MCETCKFDHWTLGSFVQNCSATKRAQSVHKVAWKILPGPKFSEISAGVGAEVLVTSSDTSFIIIRAAPILEETIK